MKALAPINFVRMGIVVATKPRALSSARAGTDFRPRTKEQLYQWYQTVVALLKRGQPGTEQLCQLLFGAKGVRFLADHGRLTSTSGRRREDDEDGEEDTRPAKRARRR